MARVAIRFAPEQVVAGLLVCCQRVLALQEGVEFRRERADLHGLLVGVKGLPPVVVNLVCADALFGTQPDRGGVPTEHCSASRGFADFLGIAWKSDVQRALPPYLLEERSVHSLRKLERDAGSVRVAHFLGIDGRMLCLFGVGIPQQISGRARIPEVAAKE